MADIKLSLLENAHNFLNHSLSQAIVAEEYPENWKYAILHLVQAIELSLKELLRREHPVLIYKNIDKPKETVSLNYAAGRLQKICNIKFEKDDMDTLTLASNYRNQIVHYEFSFKQEEIKPIYAKLLGFLQSFNTEHFKANLDDIIEGDVWKEAVNIIEYAEELYKRAEELFESEGIDYSLILECRRCYQHAFVFQDNINKCYVCGYVDEVQSCTSCKNYFYKDQLEPISEDYGELLCEQCLKYLSDQAYYYYHEYY